MGKDRKHMKKIREKRIDSVQEQIDKHEEKIQNEKDEDLYSVDNFTV